MVNYQLSGGSAAAGTCHVARFSLSPKAVCTPACCIVGTYVRGHPHLEPSAWSDYEFQYRPSARMGFSRILAEWQGRSSRLELLRARTRSAISTAFPPQRRFHS